MHNKKNMKRRGERPFRRVYLVDQICIWACIIIYTRSREIREIKREREKQSFCSFVCIPVGRFTRRQTRDLQYARPVWRADIAQLDRNDECSLLSTQPFAGLRGYPCHRNRHRPNGWSLQYIIIWRRPPTIDHFARKYNPSTEMRLCFIYNIL